MYKNTKHQDMWKYLEASGVLEHGTDEEIKAVKKSYRKEYLLAFKRKQRAHKPEYTINFNKESGEYARVLHAAGKHKISVTGFVHSAVIAYIENKYLVPNRDQVAQLEQILSDCLNEIKTIVHAKEKNFWEREHKLEDIEKRIVKMELQINAVFRNPPLLSNNDHQNKIT